MGKKKETIVETPFYSYLWSFYEANKGTIRKHYKDLTKKILDNANPDNAGAFLRKPQYEAFEMYVFLKEYLNNRSLADIFDDWRYNRGDFCLSATDLAVEGDLFASRDAESFDAAIKQLRNIQQSYSNYIFSLTMGTGKTILMALCIFYEFLLSNKFPKDPRFCKNALVLAPDTTVLQSLKEIQTFDKSKILGDQYANLLDTFIKFHFLDSDGISLCTADNSTHNLIISTSQKIILKKKHTSDSAADSLFKDSWETNTQNSVNADLYRLDDESELMANQRYTKLTRLPQLGIYVDEAHHIGDESLKGAVERSSKKSLRLTIDNLAEELKFSGSSVVACYNFTGTPYVDNHLMPEVVYEYGLKKAIQNRYLKTVKIRDYENVNSAEFVDDAINRFLSAHRKENGEFRRYEGMLPKIAFYATSIQELEQELKPAVENAVVENGLSVDSILVNVGDEKLTKNEDLREFILLDTEASQKQFILLVGKGKEGWNCRSLFAVALFRKPDSTIFVLQATMRCLRAITTEQLCGQVFLSIENKEILENELENNFRMSTNELGNNATPRPERHIYVRKKIPVTIWERVPEFSITELKPGKFRLFDSDFDESKYHKTVGEHSITNIDSETVRQDVESKKERQFTELSLIAELSIFLTQHEKDREDSSKNVVRHSPVEIRELLEQSEEGINAILEKVNYANSILYDFVIPKLFSKLYEVKYVESEPRPVTKYIVKDPPTENIDENGQHFYKMRFDDADYVSDVSAQYSAFSQNAGNEKSFDLSGYGFDSKSERAFFDRNLLNNSQIKHIWFTGMLTHGQSEFFVRYIDPETHTLRAYYPDFLVEMENGEFFIVEIKGENLIDSPTTQAKVEYARQMFSGHNMHYVFVPSKYADMILQDYIQQNAKNYTDFAVVMD